MVSITMSCIATTQTHIPLKVRSMVGLIPLFAITILESELINTLPSFKRRMQWFMDNWPDIDEHIEQMDEPGHNEHFLLAIVNHQQVATHSQSHAR